jgi:hypothetical protein
VQLLRGSQGRSSGFFLDDLGLYTWKRCEWPTIVVEAGWPELIGKLEQDILLRESQQQGKVALTINITQRWSKMQAMGGH